MIDICRRWVKDEAGSRKQKGSGTYRVYPNNAGDPTDATCPTILERSGGRGGLMRQSRRMLPKMKLKAMLDGLDVQI